VKLRIGENEVLSIILDTAKGQCQVTGPWLCVHRMPTGSTSPRALGARGQTTAKVRRPGGSLGTIRVVQI
jgi:hypothetical protein